MNTIAQDYAAELRRISRTLLQAGRNDDGEELRLAAEYLEQEAKGVALDADEIEWRLGAPALARLAVFAEALVDRQSNLFAAFLLEESTKPDRLRAFFDWMAAFYLQQACIFAVSGQRPDGRLLSEQDFMATARASWIDGVLHDAQAQATGARS